MKTRTGGFAIGFRRGGSDWQKDLGSLAAWATGSGFEAIDLGRDGDQTAAELVAAGLRVGSVDMVGGMITSDKANAARPLRRTLSMCKPAPRPA